MRNTWSPVGLFVLCAAASNACGGTNEASPPSSPNEADDGGSGSVDAGVPEGGSTDDDGSLPPAHDGGDASVEAIDAPADTWSWVDFPASRCGDGSATGIGINPHPGATHTLIYMQGGGSCTTGAACWGSTPEAVYMTGFARTEFESPLVQQKALRYPILRRENGALFEQANMVFVPYCTGDLHAGTATKDLTVGTDTVTTYFWGATDMQMFLDRLVPTFAGTERVTLAGVSAGGFGTFLSFDATVRAFGGIRVDILDDSGPPIPHKGGDGGNGAFGPWGYQPPAGCTACGSALAVYDYDRSVQPNSRYGLLTYATDTTISAAFGYTPEEFPAVIADFTAHLAGDDNAHTFVVNNTYVAGQPAHVVENDLDLAPKYLPWMEQMITDAPAWTNQQIEP